VQAGPAKQWGAGARAMKGHLNTQELNNVAE